MQLTTVDAIVSESFNIPDHRKHKVLRTLSEHEKLDLSKELVDSIYKKVSSKAYDLDYHELEASKGNFRDFEGYDNVTQSLVLLQTMDGSLQRSVAGSDIQTIMDAIDGLERWHVEFEAWSTFISKSNE